MMQEVVKALNESKTKIKIYYFEDNHEALNARSNWAAQLRLRNLDKTIILKMRANSITVEMVGTDYVDPNLFEVQKPKKKEEPIKTAAFLDKGATKELPGTMEALRRDANKAAALHMTYGQYKAQQWLANGRR